MRKIFYLMAVAIAAVAFTACSDDKTEEVSLIVNNNESEVSINRLGGEIEIPIITNGNWSVSLEDNVQNGLEWSDVLRSEGNGSTVIKVDVDYLDPSLQINERKAKVIVQSGDKKQTITVRQFIGLIEGETAENDGTEYYPDIWHGKGLGKGFNPLNGNMFANYVVNIKKAINLAKDDDDWSTLFTQESGPGMRSEVQLNDTLENNVDSLGVHCSLDVKFAKFKLNLEVDYHNGGEQKHTNSTYTGSQDLVYLTSSVSSSDIRAALIDEWDPEKVDKKKLGNWEDNAVGPTLISPGFRGTYKKIMQCTTDSDFAKEVRAMLDSFGPVFVDGATLGGSIFTAVKYDSIAVRDSFNVHGALTANIALASITIDAKADATYSKVGQDIWESSEFYSEISGGDKSTYKALLGQMEKSKPDRTLLRQAAEKWMESIRSSDDKSEDNTALIKIQYTGIWNLFPSDVAEKMKPIIAEYYKGKTLCTVKPEDLGIAPQVKPKDKTGK